MRWCAGCPACTVRRFDVPTCVEERALVIAALGARGKTVVEDIRHLLRGYEHLDRTINCLGGNIIRKTM